jgi:hypothetical protein
MAPSSRKSSSTNRAVDVAKSLCTPRSVASIISDEHIHNGL